MIRVVSLFAGCGGWDMGIYRAAADLGLDVEVVAAYDHWEPAVKCYNANLPHPVAEVRDLKAMRRDELPPHDLVIGGPPCQPFSLAGKRQGHGDERNCLPDFLRLAGDSPYVMENVISRLINAPWSEKLCAADFGDVTSRKRWFYSNYLLHVIPTPGPLRIRDIRDHDEDARVLKKRGFWDGEEMQAALGDDDLLATLTGSDFHGTKNNGSGRPTKGSKIKLGCKAGNHEHFDDTLDTLDTLTAHGWHGHDIRSGKLLRIAGEFGHIERGDNDVLPSIRATSSHGPPYSLRLGLRGNSASASASASAFEDDEVLGSILSNSFHANEASRIVACRNPSILEMARAHSIPDSFDWAGATKTQKGQLIANSVPCGMAAGVSRAILTLIAREKGLAIA